MSDLRMEVGHLRVFTNEIIVGRVTAYPTWLINYYVLTSLRAFEDIQLDVLSHYLIDDELTQTHLKHHTLFKCNLISNHQECSSSWAEIFQKEASIVCSNLTVFPRDEALRYNNVVWRTVTTKSSSILSHQIYIV